MSLWDAWTRMSLSSVTCSALIDERLLQFIWITGYINKQRLSLSSENVNIFQFRTLDVKRLAVLRCIHESDTPIRRLGLVGVMRRRGWRFFPIIQNKLSPRSHITCSIIYTRNQTRLVVVLRSLVPFYSSRHLSCDVCFGLRRITVKIIRTLCSMCCA